MFALHGILFNHEGTRRGEEFVTRKISKGVAKIHHAISQRKPHVPIELGNLDSKRDWSDSQDFVEGVWLMLNQEEHNKSLKKSHEKMVFDFVCEKKGGNFEEQESKWLSTRIKEYVLSSGETHPISEFVEKAFLAAGIEGFWQGKGLDQKYYLANHIHEEHPSLNATLVKVNSKFYRPAEVEVLLGDSSPIRKDLGWSPKTSFGQLVEKMTKFDISLLEK
jgi:GDPmannose 4,6-dehydratase